VGLLILLRACNSVPSIAWDPRSYHHLKIIVRRLRTTRKISNTQTPWRPFTISQRSR